MTPKEKSDFRALIMPHKPCATALKRFDEAEGDEVYHIIMNYAGWLFNRCISIPKLPDHITELKYDAYLRWYAHALPQLTSIGGYADLQVYDHAEELKSNCKISGFIYE